jgi:hypothetical protein
MSAERPRVAWASKDFDTLREVLTADVSCQGPLGQVADADACIRGLRGLAEQIGLPKVQVIATEGAVAARPAGAKPGNFGRSLAPRPSATVSGSTSTGALGTAGPRRSCHPGPRAPPGRGFREHTQAGFWEALAEKAGVVTDQPPDDLDSMI